MGIMNDLQNGENKKFQINIIVTDRIYSQNIRDLSGVISHVTKMLAIAKMKKNSMTARTIIPASLIRTT